MDLFIWKFILKLNWTKSTKLANHLVLIKKIKLYFFEKLVCYAYSGCVLFNLKNKL
jgi:hypothetical protein